MQFFARVLQKLGPLAKLKVLSRLFWKLLVLQPAQHNNIKSNPTLILIAVYMIHT